MPNLILWIRVMIWPSILHLFPQMTKITNQLFFVLCTAIFDYFLFYFYSAPGSDASGTSEQLSIYFVLSLGKISVTPPLSSIYGKWPNWQLIKGKSGRHPIYDMLYSHFSLLLVFYYYQFNRVKCLIYIDRLKILVSVCSLSQK